MSGISHIRLPRSLLKDPLWIDLPLAYQNVFTTIVERACFKPQKFDDHGLLIELFPGQVCISERELLKHCNRHVSRNDIQRSIKKFILYDFMSQEVRHKKSILTITHKDTYELIKNSSEPTSEPNLSQTRAKLEPEKKKGKKEEKDDIDKPVIEKISFRDNVLMKKEEYEKLVKDHGKDKIEDFIDRLSIYKHSTGKRYHSSYHTILGWIRKDKDEFKLKQIYQEDKSEYDLSDSDPFLKIHSKRGII